MRSDGVFSVLAIRMAQIFFRYATQPQVQVFCDVVAHEKKKYTRIVIKNYSDYEALKIFAIKLHCPSKGAFLPEGALAFKGPDGRVALHVLGGGSFLLFLGWHLRPLKCWAFHVPISHEFVGPIRWVLGCARYRENSIRSEVVSDDGREFFGGDEAWMNRSASRDVVPSRLGGPKRVVQYAFMLLWVAIYFAVVLTAEFMLSGELRVIWQDLLLGVAVPIAALVAWNSVQPRVGEVAQGYAESEAVMPEAGQPGLAGSGTLG